MTIESDLLTQTIETIAPLIQSKEISPVELTEAMLDRVYKIDKKLNSYISISDELALTGATQAESEIKKGLYRGPLHGVPIALKDLVNVTGIETTCASTIRKKFKPEHDATVVEKLKSAGAVILGKLNLTEFALYGYHPDYRPPNNPWNIEHWSGVSSSGSGSATGASLCFASLGTDTGGSIRFPSAACGVVGIKPTFGKISRYGVFPLSDTLDHIGPMARSVRDAAMVLEILEGRDSRDGSTRSDKSSDYLSAANQGLRGITVGFDQQYSSTDCDPQMFQATATAVELMRHEGSQIIEINRPEIVEAADHWMTICSVDALCGHEGLFPEKADDYGPVFRSLLEHGLQVSAKEYAKACKQRQATRALINELLETVDVLVCPAMPGLAGPQSDYPPQQVAAIEDIPPLVRFAAPTNFSGHPSITVPNGFDASGMPTAMQFIGKLGDESSIIRAAASYEDLTKWHTMRPDL